MCGILFTTNLSENSRFENALKIQAYRGPDNFSVVATGEKSYAGHVRLSLFDLSNKSDQPILNGDETILYNGEIFNFKDFGCEFASDTLMLKELFKGKQLYQPLLLNEFNGFFVIFKAHEGRYELVRDRYGEKPVFVAFSDGFQCSSDINSLAYLIKAELDEGYLNKKSNDPFLFETSDLNEGLDKTIYKNIYELKPGAYLSFTEASAEISSIIWYDLKSDILKFGQKSLIDLLTDSLQLRLQSDAPGAFTLSGGVDSTFLRMLASEYRLVTEEADSFSYISSKIEYSEKSVIERIQMVGGFKASFVMEEDVSWDYNEIRTSMIQLGQPYFDSNLAQRVLYRAISDRSYKFVIDGHGSDELFCGYQWHQPMLVLSSLLNLKFALALRIAKRFFKSYPSNYSWSYKFLTFGRSIVNSLFIPSKSYFGVRPSRLQRWRYEEVFGRVMRKLLTNYDNTSMGSSIESRSPFLDHRVVANVLSKKNAFFSTDESKDFLRRYLRKNGIEIPTVKIGLRTSIWDVLKYDDINKLFLDYRDVTDESVDLTLDEFIEKVKKNPSFELTVWKNLSIKYFREIEN